MASRRCSRQGAPLAARAPEALALSLGFNARLPRRGAKEGEEVYRGAGEGQAWQAQHEIGAACGDARRQARATEAEGARETTP